MSMTNECVNWIKDYFKDNPDGKAVIGISGGKDSTIAAALCVEALGADRVIGVMMPNGHQSDIEDSEEVCELLNIRYLTINIADAYSSIYKEVSDNANIYILNNVFRTNTPARLRMTVLYGVAACYPNSRVVNTCNRSEDYVGYSTKYGDAAGDFSPLGNLTVREVLEIGDELGLPSHLVHKVPSDGMCGKTDEDNLGFTYEQLDDYILGTGTVDEETIEKIEHLHRVTRHKYTPMPMFTPAVGGIIDPNQLSLFDYTKQYKRGLRAETSIIDDYSGVNLPDGNMSGNIGTFTIDPLYHSSPSYENVNLDKLVETMQKVINSAGCAGLRRYNE